MLTRTEIGNIEDFPDEAGCDCTVVVVAPVVLLVVVEVVDEDDTSGMDELVSAAMPGNPMNVRMKLSERERVPFCPS